MNKTYDIFEFNSIHNEKNFKALLSITCRSKHFDRYKFSRIANYLYNLKLQAKIKKSKYAKNLLNDIVKNYQKCLNNLIYKCENELIFNYKKYVNIEGEATLLKDLRKIKHTLNYVIYFNKNF
jgi:hypothetical protein